MKHLGRLFAILALALSPALGMAETMLDRQGDPVAVGAERFTGTLEAVRTGGQGAIAGVIINDTSYQVNGSTVLKNSSGSLVGWASFKEGDGLEFYAIDNVLTKVMPADSRESDGQQDDDEAVQIPAESSPSEPAAGGTVHLENGVWKN